MIKVKKKVYIPLIILSAASIFISVKWKTWFHTFPEAAYSVPSTPDRLMLTLGADALHQRALTWRCDTVVRSSFVSLVRTDIPQDTLHIPVRGRIVRSRAGQQAMYSLVLDRLSLGKSYKYQILCGTDTTTWHCFNTATDSSKVDFLLFGDVQSSPADSSFRMFDRAHQQYPQAQFWAFVGDMIDGPTDFFWNTFMNDVSVVAGEVPFVACAGNHEYIKGVNKRLDARWQYTYLNPSNGQSATRGSSYYLDFPLLRYIIIDTQGLTHPGSYMQTRHWLQNVLQHHNKPWTIVMMHHPIYAGKSSRYNIMENLFLKGVFSDAKVDLVIAGHDHSYARHHSVETTPVYMVCTSSPKCYLSNCDPAADKIGAGHAMYYHLQLTPTRMHVTGILSDTAEPYDDYILYKEADGKVKLQDNAISWPEVIDLPRELRDKPENKKVRQFLQDKANRAAAIAIRK